MKLPGFKFKVALASIGLSACAPALHDAPSEDKKPRLTCEADPFAPPAVVTSGERSGLVALEVTTDQAGLIRDIHPSPGMPGRGSPIFDGVVAQLRACDAALPPEVRLTKVFAMSAPFAPIPAAEAPPIASTALIAAGGTAPSSARCEPEAPPAWRHSIDGYIVHSNGQAGELALSLKKPKGSESGARDGRRQRSDGGGGGGALVA